MSLEYSITYEHSHIEIRASGRPDYLSVDKLWQDIAAACKKHNCQKVLGIADVYGWSQEHAYDHAAIFEAHGIDAAYRIAWVELNQEVLELAKLAETVVRNRALANGRVFDNAAEAQRWILAGPDND